MEEKIADENKKKNSWWKHPLVGILKPIIILLILVMVGRGFIFTNYVVNGQSMMPTIHDGERVIVNKIGYELTSPDRFDLIIFHATEESDYIKRVIGLPGDSISYKGDVLYVNGEPQEEVFLDAYKEDFSSDYYFTEDFDLEELTGETVVPEGYVFVLGDNRQNSLDSRHIGFIHTNHIVGRANMSFWPLKDLRLF